MKCLVTGSAGFIGINLCNKLLNQGFDVIGIDNFIVSTPDEMMRVCGHQKKFQFFEFDFAKSQEADFYNDIDVIYHLGGMSGVRESIEYPEVWFKNNVVGTFNVLESARRYNIQKVIIASSSASIGDVEPPIVEDVPMKPISPYGASKGFKELYASAYYHSYGMDTVALRFSNVYGPHSTIKISVIAKFIRKILKHEPLNIYGSGDQTRDFIYVDDLIDAIISATYHNVGGEVFQISTGIETSVNQVTSLICTIAEEYGYIIPKIEHTDPAAGDVLTNYADNSKAKKMLQWNPQTNVDWGINKTIEWFINEATI